MIKYQVLLLLLFSTFSLHAGISTPMYEKVDGDCKLTVMHDAVPDEQGTLILRTTPLLERECRFSKQQVEDSLDKALVQYKSQSNLADISSVFLGRLIYYPWMSDYLHMSSSSHPGWNKQAGRPVKGSSNAYVNELMSSSLALQPISRVLAKHGYKLNGMRCEKILVNTAGLPFDGLCWVRIIGNKPR